MSRECHDDDVFCICDVRTLITIFLLVSAIVNNTRELVG